MPPLPRRQALVLPTALLPTALLPTPTRAATEVILAASSNSFVLGGLRIAEQAGLFTAVDLAVRTIIMDSGNAAISALIGGSAQFAISGPGEVIAARVRKQDIVIAANLYRGLAGSLALAKTAAPNAPNAPLAARLRALDGLAIAVPSATSALLTPMKSAAEQAGAKVRWVYMAQPAMPAALEAGAIQGFVASSPFVEGPVIRGTALLWIDGPGGELPPELLPTSSSCVQMTRDVARARPNLIADLRTALADLARLIKAKPVEAKAHLARAYPTLDPAIIDLAFQKQSANWTRPLFTPDDMRHELVLQKRTGTLPGLEALDPASLLAP